MVMVEVGGVVGFGGFGEFLGFWCWEWEGGIVGGFLVG